MVRIVKNMKATANIFDKENLSIIVNGQSYKKGDVFEFLCVQSPKSTSWGTMFRNAKIKDITPDGIVSVSGISDWEPLDMSFSYLYII